jgi:hypothetical protein
MRYIKTFEARLTNSWKKCGDCGKSNPEDYWLELLLIGMMLKLI